VTLRVGMLAPISWRTPPRHYGPWEFATSMLAEALVADGVDVTLFATADSQTSGRLKAICPRPYSEDSMLDPKVWEMLHVAHAFEHAHEFDILHNQADFIPLGFSRLVRTPIVTTIHGFSSKQILPAYQAYNDRVAYVSISNADREPSLTYAATIYHGIALEDFPFNPVGGSDLLFYGRIHPDKGVVEAIETARASGHRLVIAGIIHDREYFDRRVAPLIDGERVKYVGPVGGKDRARLLGKSKALLHLINFDEPFGLTVVEAFACGTPVIAVRRGSMAELIDHGITGFLVKDVEDAVKEAARLEDINRAACRAVAERRFSVQRMAMEYRRLYRTLIEGPGLPIEVSRSVRSCAEATSAGGATSSARGQASHDVLGPAGPGGGRSPPSFR
jgi:glycosyltransferase involved in cell wall biosynthesis